MHDWSPFLGLPLWLWLFGFPTVLAALCLLLGPTLRPILRPVWRLLDRIYLLSGIAAACFMVSILTLILAQMIARWSGAPFQGATEFAGYAMACTSFFALSHALTRGAHIRVSIFLNASRRTARWLDPLAMFISALTATYFARFAIKTNIFSAILNDRTQGQDQVPEWLLALITMAGTWPSEWSELWANTDNGWVYTPIWLPQIAMSVGTVLLAICLWDMLFRTLIAGGSPIESEAVE